MDNSIPKVQGTGRELKKTIPSIREREGNEKKTIPKIREWEGNETRPNSWAKQVREIEWGHLTLDSKTF